MLHRRRWIFRCNSVWASRTSRSSASSRTTWVASGPRTRDCRSQLEPRRGHRLQSSRAAIHSNFAFRATRSESESRGDSNRSTPILGARDECQSPARIIKDDEERLEELHADVPLHVLVAEGTLTLKCEDDRGIFEPVTGQLEPGNLAKRDSGRPSHGVGQ